MCIVDRSVAAGDHYVDALTGANGLLEYNKLGGVLKCDNLRCLTVSLVTRPTDHGW